MALWSLPKFTFPVRFASSTDVLTDATSCPVSLAGGSPGADTAFEAGCGEGGGRKEIFLPWRGFNGNKSPLCAPSDEAETIAALWHPSWSRCLRPARKLHARNVEQVFGIGLNAPVSFVLFWAEEGNGVVAGGTRTNVVAAEARVEVDIRVARLKDAPALDRKFHALKAVDKRCRVEVTGGLNRPPMERTAAVVRLFQQAKELAASLGVEIEESATGGGSDGNFTSALGIPTLDGLGTVGEGAHAANESILTDRIADRVALIALLLARL